MKDSFTLRTAQDLVPKYEDEGDRILAEHYAAQDCCKCEDFLAVGIAIFDLLMQADLIIHREIYRGERSYDEAMKAQFTELLSRWLEAGHKAKKWIDENLARGYKVEHREKFEACLREAAGILTPDEDFFASDALAAIRDEALDDHARGQTVAFEAT